MRKITLRVKTNNIEEFEEIAKFASENGITHIVVSEIEKSIWQWNKDRSDPYPSWQLYFPTIFKLVVPEKLKKYLPADYAQKNFETLQKRCEILKKYGLKAAYMGSEPGYLPEEVYRDHPQWRGARCDQTRRARKPYYAPCVDNPEVREMYEEAILKLCKAAPIEYFRFHTNDCGSGLCWSSHLYPGPNGPSGCKERGAAKHAIGFLELVRDTAKKAGLNAEVGFQGLFFDDERIAISSQLKENMFCVDCYGDTGGKPFASHFIGEWFDSSSTYPLQDISGILKFGYAFLKAASNPEENLYISLPSVENKALISFIGREVKNPDTNVVEMFETLKDIAAEFIGESFASRLVNIWNYIYSAENNMSYLEHGGNIIFLGIVHQRWLVRPLVPFPEELTAQEKAYYRQFQFQARSEEEAEDLLNLQATRWLDGNGGHFLIKKTVAKSKVELDMAIYEIKELLKGYKGDKENYLLTLADRLEMFKCILTTIDNVVHYQTTLDGTDKLTPPTDVSTIHTDQGDIRIRTMMEITRSEVDNCYKMISILNKNPKKILQLEEKTEEENIFSYSVNIIDNLYKKIEIMLDKAPELNRLYATFNI